MTQRVLYTVNIPRFFVSHRLPLALAAQAAGYEVHIATSDADAENIAHIKAAGLPFHPLPLAQHGTNPLIEMRTIAALIALYRRLQPDLIHHVSIKPVIYGGIAARVARVPAVVAAMSGLGRVFSDEGAKAAGLRQVVRPLFRLALQHPNTQMIFQNPDDQRAFINLGLVAPEQAQLIRGSGVDMTHFVPTPEPVGQPIILFAGRLMWKKGIGDFVSAARQLAHQARFVVVGYTEPSSPDAVPLTRLQAWADEGIIEWWGKRDDMPQVFAQSHIVCLPSSYGEGVPKVLIEAAASARPIVTTDTAGCREITHHNENGLLFPAGDIEALIAALQRLLDDAALRQQMGQAGRQLAMADFSLQYVTDSTLALYRQLLTTS